MDKSDLFSIYNKAKTAGVKVERGRLNRALGLVQSKSKGLRFAQYSTTIKSCNCPDQARNQQYICKHRLAKMLEYRAKQKGF